MGPKVPNKWVSRVERKFSHQRSLGGHHRALGVGHDAGGEDKGDVYLRHRDKTFVVAIGSGIMVQSRGIGHGLGRSRDVSVAYRPIRKIR